MSYLLHLSDFHYNGSPEEKEALVSKFDSLSRYIKEHGFDVKYVVCTGDFIEQKLLINSIAKQFCNDYNLHCPDITEPKMRGSELADFEKSDKYRSIFLGLLSTINDSSVIDAYNRLLVENMKRLYDEFSQLFVKFLLALGVDSKHCIICCGNHDKTWFQNSGATERCGICSTFDSINGKVINDNPDQFPNDNEKCYEAYDYFCHKLNLPYNHQPILYSEDSDIEFLIMNSNHGKAYKSDLCVECIVLNDVFFSVKNHSKVRVLVTHAPARSLCESFDMNYGKNQNSSILSGLLKTISFWMCGDKHANDRRSINQIPVFMSGVFANKRDLNTSWNCRLIDYTSGDEYPDSELIYHEDKWCEDFGLLDIIELSKKYGDMDRINKLIGVPPVINSYTLLTLRNANYYHLMSNIISSVSNYKTGDEGEYIEYDNTMSIFDYLKKRLCKMLDNYKALTDTEKTTYHVLLKLIGARGVGKSSFIYALWAESMYMFSLHSKAFLPILFDFDLYKDQRTRDIGITWKAFINNCKAVSKKLGNIPVICFIDGLCSISLNNANKRLMDRVNESFQMNEHLFFIVAVDRYKELSSLKRDNLDSAIQIDWRGNDYMCMNSIEINKYKDKCPEKELRNIVHCSINLGQRQFTNVDKKTTETVEFLKKLGYAEITLGTLKTVINSQLFDIWKQNKKKDTARLLFYKILCERWESSKKTEQMEKNAYDLSFGEIVHPKDNSLFLRLALDKDYRDFLSAQYIIRSLLTPNSRVELYWRISHSVAILVRSGFCLLKPSHSSRYTILDGVLRRKKDRVSLIVVYLIGTCLKANQRSQLLEKVLNYYQLPSVVASYEYNGEIYKKIATHFFASFLSLFGSDSGIDIEDSRAMFFGKLAHLINNPTYRKYYRIFMLDYYGDLFHNMLSVSEIFRIDTNSLKKLYGNDFKRYYAALAANIKNQTAEFPDEYVVLLLCDIVYSRLKLSIEYLDGAFFFSPSSKRYNDQRNILNITITCIEHILNRPSEHRRCLYNLKDSGEIYNTYYRYLTTMHGVFNDCLSAYQAKRASSANAVFNQIKRIISPAWAFECLTDLKWQPRVGWYYAESPGFGQDVETTKAQTKEVYLSNRDNYYPETIATHCFESMLIAEVYLPDTEESIKRFEPRIGTAGYDKNIVIRMLLTHEFGKAETGDEPEKHIQEAEKEKYYNDVDTQMYRIMITGALCGFTSGHNMRFLQSKVKLQSNTHDYTYNENLAIDIGIIQREYTRIKYANKLNMTEKRNKDFESSQKEINTGFGKELLKILILENPYLLQV